MKKAWLICVAFAVIAGCKADEGRGSAGQACYPNGTCNDGLICKNGTCVVRGIGRDAIGPDEDVQVDTGVDPGGPGADARTLDMETIGSDEGLDEIAPGDTGRDTVAEADTGVDTWTPECQAGPCCVNGRWAADGTKCPDDSLDCTDDLCEAHECVHRVLKGYCLIKGSCVRAGSDNPENPCQWCSPGMADNDWSNKANGTWCDDNDPCTLFDHCAAGKCESGAPVTCAPAGECKKEGHCAPDTGLCVYEDQPDGTPCNHGHDKCASGVCRAAPCVCAAKNACCDGCFPLNEAGPCDDGNPCTLGDTCLSGVCHTGVPKTCDPPDDCHEAGTCDTRTGKCVFPQKTDGALCDPGPAWQYGTCVSGKCQAHVSVDYFRKRIVLPAIHKVPAGRTFEFQVTLDNGLDDSVPVHGFSLSITSDSGLTFQAKDQFPTDIEAGKKPSFTFVVTTPNADQVTKAGFALNVNGVEVLRVQGDDGFTLYPLTREVMQENPGLLKIELKHGTRRDGHWDWLPVGVKVRIPFEITNGFDVPLDVWVCKGINEAPVADFDYQMYELQEGKYVEVPSKKICKQNFLGLKPQIVDVYFLVNIPKGAGATIEPYVTLQTVDAPQTSESILATNRPRLSVEWEADELIYNLFSFILTPKPGSTLKKNTEYDLKVTFSNAYAFDVVDVTGCVRVANYTVPAGVEEWSDTSEYIILKPLCMKIDIKSNSYTTSLYKIETKNKSTYKDHYFSVGTFYRINDTYYLRDNKIYGIE